MSRLWVAIQRNPRSGSGRGRRRLMDLAAALRRQGLRPHLFSRRERLAERLLDPARRESLVGIVAAGGDGTVGDVVNRCPGIPVCPFPLGTENVLSKYLGIPPDGDFVAKLIASGRRQRFDLGLAGERQRFLLMASVGFDAEVVARLHADRTGHISHLSYLKPMWLSARRYGFPLLKVTDETTGQSLTGAFAVLSNFPAYAMKLPVNPDAKADDGLLTVRVFREPGVKNFFRYWSLVWRRRHLELDEVPVLHAREVTIDCERPGGSAGSPKGSPSGSLAEAVKATAPVQIDGDPWGTTPVTLKSLPGELELFAPGSEPV